MESHGPRAPLERRLAAALGIAATAALVEVVGSWWSGSVALLGPSARRNINIRGAFLHAYGDTLGSVGVVVAAVLIAWTGLVLLDTLIAIFIVLLIGASTVRLLRDSVRIILEGTPAGLQPQDVAHEIRSVPGVRGVHDLHVWTVTSGLVVLTGHLSVEGSVRVQEAAKIVDAVHARSPSRGMTRPR